MFARENDLEKGDEIMRTLNIDLPENLDLDALDAKLIIATKLYEQGRLSLGEAAQIAGVSKRTFIELLGRYDVSLFNYGVEELEEDLKNA